MHPFASVGILSHQNLFEPFTRRLKLFPTYCQVIFARRYTRASRQYLRVHFADAGVWADCSNLKTVPLAPIAHCSTAILAVIIISQAGSLFNVWAIGAPASSTKETAQAAPAICHRSGILGLSLPFSSYYYRVPASRGPQRKVSSRIHAACAWVTARALSCSAGMVSYHRARQIFQK